MQTVSACQYEAYSYLIYAVFKIYFILEFI